MDIQVRFKGICYDSGEHKLFTHSYKTDQEFRTHSTPNKFKELVMDSHKFDSEQQRKAFNKLISDTTVVTAFEKADEYVGELDKMNIIYGYNLSSIIDWEIISVGDETKDPLGIILKTSNELLEENGINSSEQFKTLLETLKTNNIDNQLIIDMAACYAKQFENIKSLEFDKQVDIVMTTVSSAYDASVSTLDGLKEYQNKLKSIPSSVWKDAFRQGNMSSSEFIQKYMDGSLDKKYLTLTNQLNR